MPAPHKWSRHRHGTDDRDEPGLADDVAQANTGEQSPSLRRGEVLLRTTRQQFQQQLVKLGDLAGVLITQRAPAIHQQSQRLELLISNDRT